MKRLLVNLINFYQIFSPAIFAGVCRYEVTCSEYTKLAMQKHGIWMGIKLGIKRIWSCR